MGFRSKEKYTEQSPAQRVEQALGAFTQAKDNLSALKSDLDSERAILEEQLRQVTESGDRVEGILGKISSLLA